MSSNLTIYNDGKIDNMIRIAKAMKESGFFSDSTEIAQAFVKIQAGEELGFAPFASMSGLHVIKGKPSLSANSMATLVKAHPKYDYRVREISNANCVIEFFEGGDSLGTSEFSAKDAQAAGTQNMGKFPRNMLFARSMSNGVKWFCPDVMAGMAVYTPEELGAEVDEDGELIDITPRKQVKQLEEKNEVTETAPEKTTITQEPDTTPEAQETIDEGAFEEVQEPAKEDVEKPEPDKLTDGELVIYEAGAENYLISLIALIDRYDNEFAVKGALKKLGQTGYPRGNDHNANMRRVKQYRMLRDHAEERDMEEATQATLV